MAKSLCCLLALVTNFDVANMSFNAHIRVYFRIYSSLCLYMYLIHVKGIKNEIIIRKINKEKKK